MKMLPQATSQAPPTKGGKLWRLLVGEEDQTSSEEGRAPVPTPPARRPPPDPTPASSPAGANTVQVSLNRGVLPHEMFMEQIRRFAAKVLPALQSHRVERVPIAEEVAA